LEPLTLGLLAVVAFLTSILSAVVGFAGGMVLLSTMLLFLDPLFAIPLHAVVQLVSNGSRSYIQRAHIDWSIVWRFALPLLPTGVIGLIVWRFALPLLPTGVIGLWILQSLSPSMARAMIGAFVLLATWAPQLLLLGVHPENISQGKRFLALGAVVGAVNVTVGATGPLIAPFFLNLGLSRHAIVGTKAACQAISHVVKIVVFGVVGFAFAHYALPLLLLCAAVVAGTWIGSQVLGRVSERLFLVLYKGVITVVALRLVLWEGALLLGWR
jgi:uncharacterized membrane protein YfcA